jgi:hypothetical protein
MILLHFLSGSNVTLKGEGQTWKSSYDPDKREKSHLISEGHIPVHTVRKMGLILRSIVRIPEMQVSMARIFTLLCRY